jgi:UDP-N-acetyl-D-glucosamine dehydrogenase
LPHAGPDAGPDAGPHGPGGPSPPGGDFHSRLLGRQLTVGVFGLGYVGLPLAVAFAEAGFRTLGFDLDRERVAGLQLGRCHLQHFDLERIARVRASGKFEVSSRPEVVAEMDVALIAVPTPLQGGNPDLSSVVLAAELLRAAPRTERLVLLESTVFPRTTEDIVRPILDETSGELGQDYYLAYSPEREDPGNREFSLASVPKVVGALDGASLARACAFYALVFTQVVPVADARTAEAVKLAENVFRAVNVALVNELKVAYAAMGVDVWEVLEAAATKPFGYMRFDPGPGVGGHCIPIDPHYLLFQARNHGANMPLTTLALELNAKGPYQVVALLEAALLERGVLLRNAKILLLGVAYKKDIEDVRESPALSILRLLVEKAANVAHHDRFVPLLSGVDWPGGELRSLDLTPEVVCAMDAVVLVTDHSAVDYNMVAEYARLVVDTRGVYRSPFPGLVRA